MKYQAWRERFQQWDRFSEWEKSVPASQQKAQALKLAGEWVDFFLKRFPRKPEPPDTSGIEKLHKKLSVLSKFE